MDGKTKTLLKSVSLGFIYKLLSIIISFINIPLTIKFLGTEEYGVWITLFTTLTWINTLDVGIGNGLKLKLTKSLSNNNYDDARRYMATSYFLVSAISFIMFLLGFFVLRGLDFTSIFGTNKLSNSYLFDMVIISFLFAIINFIFSLYKQLLYSINKSELINLSSFLLQVIILCCIVAIDGSDNKLIDIAIIYGVSNLVVSFVFTFYFFYTNKNLHIDHHFFDVDKVRSVTKIGGKFFIIQISSVIIYSTDNLIVAHNLSASHVTNYSLVSQLFMAFLVFWYTLSAPLVSLFINAYSKNDMQWIISVLKKLHAVFFCLIPLVMVCIYFGRDIIFMWTGLQLDYSSNLFLYFGFFTLIRVFGDIFLGFINAVGSLNIQMYSILLGSLFNIPLSIFFVVNLGMGESGVILATCISLSLVTVAAPLQTYFIIKKWR